MPLILMRHAQSMANVDRVFRNTHEACNGLSALGHEQAEAAARTLVAGLGRPIDRIVSSPLRRAQETAAPLHRWSGAPVSRDDDLRELDVGAWEGSGDAETWAAHDRVFHLWFQDDQGHVRAGGGESRDDAARRLSAAIDRVLPDVRRGLTVVLVSHVGLAMTGLPPRLSNVSYAFAYNHHIRNTEQVWMEPGDGGELTAMLWADQDLREAA